MGRTKNIARKSTHAAPLKPHRTPPRGRKAVKRRLMDTPSTTSMIYQDDEARALVLPNLKNFSNTDLRAGLSLLHASIGSCSTALVERYDATVREVLTKEYNQALEERDSALKELDNMGAELMEVQRSFSKAQAEFESGKKAWKAEFESGKKAWKAEKKELTERLTKEFNIFGSELNKVQGSFSKAQAEFESGKKAWEAEKKELTERLNKVFNIFGTDLDKVLEVLSKSKAELEQSYKEQESLQVGNVVWEAGRMEMAEKIEMVEKEKDNAYCKGYLDGWFKKPHAHVLAWHEAKLAAEVTDHCVLQMMRKLPKSQV